MFPLLHQLLGELESLSAVNCECRILFTTKGGRHKGIPVNLLMVCNFNDLWVNFFNKVSSYGNCQQNYRLPLIPA